MAQTFSSTININTACQEELENLPGIGKTKAQLILEQREILGSFSSIEDLLTINGITKSRLESLREHIRCSSSSSENDTESVADTEASLDDDEVKSSALKRKFGINIPKDNKIAMSSPEKRKKQVEFSPSDQTPPSSADGNRPFGMPSCAVPSCTVRRRLNSQASEPPGDMQMWLDQFMKWSGEERLYALDALIYKCDMSIVRHIMAKIEPHFQRDFISLLPKELALYVLSFLEPRDLCRAAQTCKYWRILAEDAL